MNYIGFVRLVVAVVGVLVTWFVGGSVAIATAGEGEGPLERDVVDQLDADAGDRAVALLSRANDDQIGDVPIVVGQLGGLTDAAHGELTFASISFPDTAFLTAGDSSVLVIDQPPACSVVVGARRAPSSRR